MSNELITLDYSSLPEGLEGCMRRYIEDRLQPGSFLSAVLENNLRESFATADNVNRYAMFDIVSWVYNNAPASCWGSPEKVKQWLEQEQ